MKNILLIATGGTIACQATNKGLVPTLSGHELAGYLSAFSSFCRISVLDLMNIDSTDMTTEQRVLIAKTVWANLDAYDGFVITHGTDSLAYTSALLFHMLSNLRKPVILTGSQKPMGEENSDAEVNLKGAVLTACSHYIGVAVCACGKIIRGNRAVKTHSTEFDAFKSVNAPFDGKILPNGDVIIAHMQEANATPSLLCDINENVALLKIIPNFDPDLLLFCAKYSAVILEVLGSGGVPKQLLPALGVLNKSKTAVYVISQCLGGASDLSTYEVGRRAQALGAVSLGDKTAEEALAIVMCRKTDLI